MFASILAFLGSLHWFELCPVMPPTGYMHIKTYYVQNAHCLTYSPIHPFSGLLHLLTPAFSWVVRFDHCWSLPLSLSPGLVVAGVVVVPRVVVVIALVVVLVVALAFLSRVLAFTFLSFAFVVLVVPEALLTDSLLNFFIDLLLFPLLQELVGLFTSGEPNIVPSVDVCDSVPPVSAFDWCSCDWW